MENKVVNYASYEALAITTKCYSDKVAFAYVALGLCGELGELYEKIKNDSDEHLTELEFQDVMWYLAAIRIEFDLEKRIDWPELTNRKVGPFDLPAAIGKIAEQVKKYLRDDWKDEEQITPISEERKKKIQLAWDEVMQLMVDFNTQAFNLSMNEQGQQNIEKLADRARRDKIKGSGDER